MLPEPELDDLEATLIRLWFDARRLRATLDPFHLLHLEDDVEALKDQLSGLQQRVTRGDSLH